MTTDASKVRSALAIATDIRSRVGVREPRLDAYIAILNSDLLDRTWGLTLNGEKSPGLSLALRVRGVAR